MDLEFAGCFVGRIADEDRKVNDVIVIGVRCGGEGGIRTPGTAFDRTTV